MRRLMQVVLSVLAVALLGVATNVATGVLPREWIHYQWIAWPAIGVFVLVLIVLGVVEKRGENKPVRYQSSRARRILTDRVRRYWIQGVLERSLYYEARLELKLTVAVPRRAYPWDIAAFYPNGTAIEFSPDVDVKTMFEALNSMVVILGDPGSGKTTMLLELARRLLEDAELDASNPIPVVLPLSSWAIQRKPIAKWIIDQLETRYGIPSQLASDWVNEQAIAPLFDGLDEVSDEQRNNCATAINAYLRENSLTSSALCCRRAEYDLLRQRPDFYGILTIEPLTRQQVETYLDDGGPGLEGLRTALTADPGLWELAESPLLLSIMALAYPAGEDMAQTSPLPDQRQNLYNHYVRAMLRRRTNPLYSPGQSAKYLSVLATRLQRTNQTVFTLDLLNGNWLTKSSIDIKREAFDNYAKAVASLSSGLIVFMAGWGLLGWKAGVIAGIFCIVFIRLALSSGAYDNLSYISSLARKDRRISSTTEEDISIFLKPVEWIVGVVLSVNEAFSEPSTRLSARPAWLRIAGVLALFVLVGITISLQQTVKTAVAYTVLLLFIVLVALGAAFYASIDAGYNPTISPSRHELPSPMLRARLRMAIWTAIVTGVVCATAVTVWAPLATLSRPRVGTVVGLFAVVLVLAVVAGTPIIEQLMIRRKLMRDGNVPWPYLPFLDFIVKCLLLRSVGTGYIFVHRELQEFIASGDLGRGLLECGEPGDAGEHSS